MIDELLKWAKVEEPWELWLLAFGLVAQAMFFGRWIVQWVASEKRGESHMPILFWWLSLIGASMLMIYFVLRREPIGMLGQSVGWIVYSRNIYLLHKAKGKEAADDASSTVGDAPAAVKNDGKGAARSSPSLSGTKQDALKEAACPGP
jgi:lipid-A-disaccharide synthase-like uncharacterized protein